MQKAMSFAQERPFLVQDYLKYTPVNVAEQDKYPYDRPDLWEKIQYLPDGYEGMRFYVPSNASKYQEVLNETYQRLLKQGRSNDLASLKKEK